MIIAASPHLRRTLVTAALALGAPDRRDVLPDPPEARYRLAVRVDDQSGVVTGNAEILYRLRGTRRVRSLALRLGRSTLVEARIDGEILPPAALTASGDTARLRLPRSLAPGDSITLSLVWQSTASHTSARRLELSDWYPRIVDEVSGATVAEPAFGTVLLRLDVAKDQVLAATGVPLCGDPGWRSAAALPDTRVTLQRDWYREPRDQLAREARCGAADPGRKIVTWYAEGVMDAAVGMSPTFRYEEGDFLERPVRVLYEQGQERSWGAGLAARRTEAGMAWILELGGRYPWPQLTVLPAIGAPDQALPMLILAGSPAQASLLDLLGLMATQQILGGGARMFTVGTAAYQTAWFFETLGRRDEYTRLERQILDWDLDGLAIRDEPLPNPAESAPCVSTGCRRMEFTSFQLRQWAGTDEAMRRLYRTVYDRYQLRPTQPGVFQRIAAELIHPSPDPLYAQLPNGGTLYDDALTAAHREPIAGGWRTTLVVRRLAPGRFPQTVWVVADSDTAAVRAVALAPVETLTVVTRTRPRRVILDPLAQSHDWNMLNNQRTFGRGSWRPLTPQRPTDSYLDTYFSRRTARDRLTVGWAPVAWYNDVAGWTLGGRVREDYLGRFELNEAWLSVGTGWGPQADRTNLNGRLALRNLVGLRMTGWSQEFGIAWEEGRAETRAGMVRRFRTSTADSTVRTLGASLGWLTVTSPVYLDDRSWDDAGTVELTLSGTVAKTDRKGPARVTASIAAGYAYPNSTAAPRAVGYGRLLLEGTARRSLSSRLDLGARAFIGLLAAADPVPTQRRMTLAGADPYQRFGSPFLRSRGSLLATDGFHFHAPGGAGLRGLDPTLSAPHALGATIETEYALWRRPPGGLLSRIALAAFLDGALADGDLADADDRLTSAGDAGVGVRLDYKIGRTAFQTRLDLPLWVSRPELAQDTGPSGPVGFRWTFGLMPPF